MSVRIPASEKALLARAAALRGFGLTQFVRQHSLQAAKEVIAEAERLRLSTRDSIRLLELLEDPPAPNARLLAAARALPVRK